MKKLEFINIDKSKAATEEFLLMKDNEKVKDAILRLSKDWVIRGYFIKGKRIYPKGF